MKGNTPDDSNLQGKSQRKFELSGARSKWPKVRENQSLLYREHFNHI